MKNLQQLQNKLNNTFENIDSIVWFGLNYNYDFIDQCWSDDKCLANHLKDKFAICEEPLLNKEWNPTLSCGLFTRFLTMLDDGNRHKLYQYILGQFSKKNGYNK